MNGKLARPKIVSNTNESKNTFKPVTTQAENNKLIQQVIVARVKSLVRNDLIVFIIINLVN